MASSRSEERLDVGLSNISLVVEEGLCTGCGTCVGLCPEDCITIKSNYVLGSREPVVEVFSEDLDVLFFEDMGLYGRRDFQVVHCFFDPCP